MFETMRYISTYDFVNSLKNLHKHKTNQTKWIVIAHFRVGSINVVYPFFCEHFSEQ